MKKETFIFIFIISFILSISVFSKDKPENYLMPNKCGWSLSKEKKLEILSHKSTKILDDRFDLQCSYPSPDGWFLIHYDSSGNNSVPKYDSNKNGIPDYIDSVAYYFDYVWKIEVETIGYKAPLSDNGEGGSNAYDVYLFDLGNGYTDNTYYGWTAPCKAITEGNITRYVTYIVIDNDFSITDSTINETDGTKYRTYSDTGVIAMKITAAHEFHHAIQDSYADALSDGVFPNQVNLPVLNEMTSSWMESRVFPESTDNLQYIRQLLLYPSYYPFGLRDSRIGYSYAIFGSYLYKYYLDYPVRRMWELIGLGIPGYKALDSAISEKTGTGLITEWCKFLNWLYYTGHRADTNLFIYSDKLPAIKSYDTTYFESPEIYNTGRLSPFEFRVFTYLFPSNINNGVDTLVAFVSNTDFIAANTQNENTTHVFKTSIIDYNKEPYRLIDNNSLYYYNCEADNFYIYNNYYFSNGLATIDYAFPNPFKPNHDNNTLYFPIAREIPINRNDRTNEVHIEIYSSEMGFLFSKKLKVVPDDFSEAGKPKYKVAIWENVPNDISAGVYIYKLDYRNTIYWGKFVVIK